jgi:thioredoxin reductase (NADPH)
MSQAQSAEVIIVGGGLAGLSAAIYLGRAKRQALVIDAGKSMARWEPDVQNYLGFPKGISGPVLLEKARQQARRYHVRFRRDCVSRACVRNASFSLRGRTGFYTCRRLLLTTGIFHVPPDVPGIEPCLGHSLFFCKDCDGYRVQGKRIAIYGWSNEAVEYALGMLPYSDHVAIVTNGHSPSWTGRHELWITEYRIPHYQARIVQADRRGACIRALHLEDGLEVHLDALFTTRGDIYFNELAKELGAKVNAAGDVVVDLGMRTTVEGLYAAGCVTPANCQMIIAAGQGAIAAQAINRDLFEESLATHSLRRFRRRQLRRRVVK